MNGRSVAGRPPCYVRAPSVEGGGSRTVQRTLVETRYGRIEGIEADGVRVWRGVPFARAPVGTLRWRAPRPPEPWPGVREAQRFGPVAPQNPSATGALLGLGLGEASEDCLNLNVYAPSEPGRGRPVLVWLHGGGFTFGAGSQPVYDGSALARRGGVVVVTANYRLGVLGWLGLPSLADDDGSIGNCGLLDQIAVLEWVREHAERFGGDPSNVTLFGESAGAMSIGALLGAPRARGLFRRAILQSGAAHHVTGLEAAERVAEALVKELGVDPRDARRLRELPVSALLEVQQRALRRVVGELRGLPFQPVLDGVVLPEPPLAAVAAGAAAGVSLLVGTNLDEWRLFGLADPKLAGLDEAGLLRRLERALPGAGTPAGASLARRAFEVYTEARRGRLPLEPPELWLAFETDRVFRIPALRLAEAQGNGASEVFVYLFAWRSPAFGGRLGACHALEIPFVFGCVERLRSFVGEHEAALRLERRMQDAWLSFARGGAPGSDGIGSWPPYQAPDRATAWLDAEPRVERAPFEAERRFWDGIL